MVEFSRDDEQSCHGVGHTIRYLKFRRSLSMLMTIACSNGFRNKSAIFIKTISTGQKAFGDKDKEKRSI